jgi:hypothetical protein
VWSGRSLLLLSEMFGLNKLHVIYSYNTLSIKYDFKLFEKKLKKLSKKSEIPEKELYCKYFGKMIRQQNTHYHYYLPNGE